MGKTLEAPQTQQRLAFGVEYDGGAFHGWQIQAGVTTVQGALERALSAVAAEPVRVVTAGRTDAGVHATGQVVHFDTLSRRSDYAWVRGTNTQAPRGLAVNWVRNVSRDFHARFSATGRAYRYIILNRAVRPTILAGRVAWFYRPLNVEAMQQAADYLIGRHDFSAYRASGCQSHQPVREVRKLGVSRAREWVLIDIEADGFLHHMVRNIAGVLCAIGSGDQAPGWAQEVLESCDRRSGGVTASADGLYLTRVDYPGQFNLPMSPPPCQYW